MIKNFEEIKKELRELAGIINSFKSEAVQLRLIELVFDAAESERGGGSSGRDKSADGRDPPRRGKARSAKKVSTPKEGKAAKAKATGRPGGKATLDRLLAEGFFKKPKTIKQVVEHCAHHLAFKYKQSEFSGALGRLTRDGALKRAKNADKQYEYSQV